MKKTFSILLFLAGTALFGNVIFIKAPTVAGGGGTTITDNFNRATAELSTSPSPEGWSWVKGTGANLVVYLNTLYGTANNTGIYYADSSLGGPDMEVEITATIEKLGSTTSFYPIARYTDSDNYYKFQRSHNTNDFRLYRRVSGTTTQIGSAYSADPTPPYTMKIVVDGDQISGYVDGVLRVGPVTDTNITTGNYSGVGTYVNGSNYIPLDDFAASSL